MLLRAGTGFVPFWEGLLALWTFVLMMLIVVVVLRPLEQLVC
jgi:hypothetical protein